MPPGGVANRLLPMVESHPLHIALWLSARGLASDVFPAMPMASRGPRFILDGLRFGEGPSSLALVCQLQLRSIRVAAGRR